MNNEAAIAEYYRHYHKLARPNITWKTFLLRVISVLLACLVISLVVYIAMSAYYKVIEEENSPLNYFLRLYAFWFCMICLLLHKAILISCIELYQHYSPERIRRKCICMPSCSVYATMTLKKYNTIKAIWMILNRLSNCKGIVCIINYP